MKGKAGERVMISGVYREVTLEGLVIAEVICMKNETFPPTAHNDNYYEIKMIASSNDEFVK